MEGSIRPDMWGYDEAEPRVYIENKFWAGLTDNQPVSYLKQLAQYTQPAILLVVVPDAREQTMRRELVRRLKDAGISLIDRGNTSDSIVHSIMTGIGPILALTSWTRLLAALELEVAEDPSGRSDILQLRALCEAADSEAFVPISSSELTDQLTPAFILQLNTIVQASVELAVSEDILSIGRLLPQANWERIGRYARFLGENAVGIWIGIQFNLWKKYGGTPLWVLFLPEFGRSLEVRPILEPWATKEGIVTSYANSEFAVALDIAVGEDKDQVVRGIVDRLKDISKVLSELNPKPLSSDDE